MIPKKIHYCWFGGNPLPKSALKCINSWKKFFPDYEIIEWNTDNYDVNKAVYTKQAYQAKKYAFVSDYARFDILYNEGGIYFDTDVEVIKPFDDILKNGAFMGCEIDGDLINPGLGIGAEKGMDFYKKILDYYNKIEFLNKDGSINTETIVLKTTRLLKEQGLKSIFGIQKIDGITIYPKEYFNPLNSNTGELNKTENTHSIHWYSMTWLSNAEKIRLHLARPFHRFFGDKCFAKIKQILNIR